MIVTTTTRTYTYIGVRYYYARVGFELGKKKDEIMHWKPYFCQRKYYRRKDGLNLYLNIARGWRGRNGTARH